MRNKIMVFHAGCDSSGRPRVPTAKGALRTAVCGYNYDEERSAVDGTVDSAESASVSRVSDSEAGREGAEGTD